ncbi:MAG: response regulator transcription factor [Acidobacteria bacterium]|nr:response regulator transcription factor [Acidobacteriota bacterium]
MDKRILLVEGEPGLVLTLTDRLASEGYLFETTTDGVTALAEATRTRFDLLILDVMLPGTSGFDVCRELRARGIDTRILMLTARSQIVDKVIGLKLGADDYLTKPFEMSELLARVEAQLRRASQPAPPGPETHTFGPLRVDFRKAEISRDGEPVELSALECHLLRYFTEHREAVLSRDQILNDVWGAGAMPSSRTVDIHVAWLRRKIEPDPRHPRFIVTVHGLGYKFVG